MWQWVLRVSSLSMLVVLLAGWASFDSRVVLGIKGLYPYGTGWGTAEPRVIYNGGVPSGRAWKIRWSDWGAKVAFGSGLNWIYRPQGGYYSRPATIELRAYDIGKCSRGGPRAYRRLQVRVPSRPGGPLGRWQSWGGRRTICRL